MKQFKKKYLLNAALILIAIIFGFGLSQFMDPYSHFIELFEKHKLLQKCTQDSREITFLLKGGEYFPDYENPRTLNDKIGYLLNNYFQKSPITKCIGTKYFAKKYISDIVGEEHVAKLLGVWDNPEEIEWDKLPNQFVLKGVRGHFGNQVVFIKNKNEINIPEITKKLKEFCEFIGICDMEIKKKRIIAEEYLEQANSTNGIIDYKFFYSYGNPIMMLCYNYNKAGTCDHNDKEASCYSLPMWEELPISLNNRKQGSAPKPKHFAKMMELAAKLSKPFPLIRVDFYEVGDRVIVGELTEDACGAKYIFSPLIWDFKFGEMINVPSLSEIEKMIEKDKEIYKKYAVE